MSKTLTQSVRDQATKLAEIGLNDVQIAARLALSVKHLRKYLADELREGRSYGDTELAKTATQMALSGLYPAFTKYMCQVRLGWYEVSGLIVSNGDGVDADGDRLAAVIDERLSKLRSAMEAKIKTVDVESVK